MLIDRLDDLPTETSLEADIVVVGGGPCGLSVARELIDSGLRVLVLESGLTLETKEHAALNTVDKPPLDGDDRMHEMRAAYHSALPSLWDEEQQRFGVRCRGLGGSTQAWAGKSASFDEIDFEHRSWIPHSGWPISRQSLAPYVDRAGRILNLGPNTYDDSFWDLAGQQPPRPEINSQDFTSFFWQFSRSRLEPLETMRCGADFATLDADNVRVLVNATVTRICSDDSGERFDRLDVSTIDGRQSTVRAKACVLAASTIENARLLLLSTDTHPSGLGNRNDLVGRYLTDHVQTQLGTFDQSSAQAISRRFGFFGLRHAGRSHMYSHGLALSKYRQVSENLSNGAVYFMETRAEDDPVSALGRLVRRRSTAPYSDIATVARSPGHLLKTVGLKTLESDRMPERVRHLIVESVVRRLPNMAAREYRFRGLPHKLTGAEVQGIVEQVPDRNNRVTLSLRQDPLGLAMPLIQWRVASQEQNTMLRMAEILRDSFVSAGMPCPETPEWVSQRQPEAATLIDMGHTMGTTRMSESPSTGVVDTNLRLHDVQGVYLAGGSVMPTTGHANPTLMMVALSIRLADHLKREYCAVARVASP